MKNLIAICLFLMTVPVACSQSFANDIYKANGEIINKAAYTNIWPVQFKVKADADLIASGLENGQVFQDQDTKLYQVWYGNVQITGLIVTSNITEQ